MELFYSALAWFIGAFITGLSGVGGALIAVPVMSLFLEIHAVVVICNIIMIFICLFISIKYRKFSSQKSTLPLTISCFPGVIVGTFILLIMPAVFIQIIIALFLIFYSIWSLINKNKATQMSENKNKNKKVMIVCGFFTGLVGGSISFPGPILAIYALYANYNPKQALSVMSTNCLIIGVFTFITHLAAGLYSNDFLPYIFSIIPAVAIGFYITVPILKYVTDDKFKKLVIIVIGVSGIFASVRAFAQLGIF